MDKTARGMGCGLGLVLALALASGGCSSTGEVATSPTDAPATPTAPDRARAPAPTHAVVTPATTGTGTYESNLGDYALEVRDVMAHYDGPLFVGAGFASTLTIELVELAGRCADYGTGVARRNGKTVAMEIQRIGPTGADAAMRPGTYTIGKAAKGEVAFARRVLTPACTVDAVASPFDAADDMGQIVVTSFAGTHITGTYELHAIDGRFVRGSFDAELCDATAPSTTSVCQ